MPWKTLPLSSRLSEKPAHPARLRSGEAIAGITSHNQEKIPCLSCVAATKAVVAGTAGAVRHHQAKKWAKQDAAEQAQDAQATPEEYYDEPEYEEASPPQEDDTLTQLERLGALRDQGVLSEEEFEAQKEKLLASLTPFFKE